MLEIISLSMIKLNNIHKSYCMSGREDPVLKGVDLTIGNGQMVALMGPSGSGKSTLMNIIGLLDQATSGEYFLQGKKVSDLTNDQWAHSRNESIGFVFQQFFLLPRLNALQNVTLPLFYRGGTKTDSEHVAREKLKSVGMENFWHHKPAELSGGQQQRVAIARALVSNPTLILADEPTGALDSKTGQEVLDILAALNCEKQCTILIVTHDEQVASRCKRIVRMRDGLTYEDGA